MEEMIEKLEAKLDKLDQQRKDLQQELDNKKFQLQKVQSLIDGLEDLQEDSKE